MRLYFIIICVLSLSSLEAQNKVQDALPYYELPEAAQNYTAGTVASRLVDGLGFRFYWASKDLNNEDLNFKPSEDARTTSETIDHILNLSYVILNSTLKQPNTKNDFSELSYEAKREQTLINLKAASDILKSSDDIAQFEIIFGESKVPFWNNINGPIADAIWHCGQIASYRRSSGNPINPNINHFSGTVKE